MFGDQPIDIPMFSVADLSVAVENAHPDVKSSADVIIGNNDCDSVIDFIDLIITKTNRNEDPRAL